MHLNYKQFSFIDIFAFIIVLGLINIHLVSNIDLLIHVKSFSFFTLFNK
jgi:hypothetical protein